MLVVSDLVKVYAGSVTALQDVSLEVPNGLFGLLGPNGAGKSTLMRIIAGLLEPTSGSVTLDGRDLLSEPSYVWKRLGYLPQDFGFYPHLTGRDMLLHLLKLKGVRAKGGLRRLTDELLERVNLQGSARRKIREYSGGMRQRLGIAQALAGDPRIIVVDEPTAGLDPQERLRFYHLLAELAENRIVLLSTHIVEDVSVLCPAFAVIKGGRVRARTTPAEALLPLRGAIFEKRVDRAELGELREHHALTHAVPVGGGSNRVRLFLPVGSPPEGFRAVEPTLEDAYFVLMNDENGTAAEAELVGSAVFAEATDHESAEPGIESLT